MFSSNHLQVCFMTLRLTKCPCTSNTNRTDIITVMPDPTGFGVKGVCPPLKYLADQLTLFQMGVGILSPPTTVPPPIFSPSGITALTISIVMSRYFTNFLSSINSNRLLSKHPDQNFSGFFRFREFVNSCHEQLTLNFGR